MLAIWLRQPMFWVGTALRIAAIAVVLAAHGPFSLPGTAIPPLAPAGPLADWFVTALAASGQHDRTIALSAVAAATLIADLAMLAALRSLLDVGERRLLQLYWLSPAVLLVAYPQLAFADLTGAALLCWALACTRHDRPLQAGYFAALSPALSFTGAFAVPLFLIYYFRNPTRRAQLSRFAAGLAAAGLLGLIVWLPLLSGDLIASDTTTWHEQILSLGISTGAGQARIQVAPVVYILCLFATWRMRRIGPDLFLILCGLMYLILSMVAGLPAAWILWAVPMLVYVCSESGTVSIGLTNILAALYVAAGAEVAPDVVPALAFAACLVITASIWRYNVQRNDFLRIARKPVVIGIAGDSGAGKDTLVDAIAHLFEDRSVVRLSGDDYHFWDRHKPMWRVMTHLNPRANDLGKFARDLIALADGKGIVSPHYDHGSGRMSRPIQTQSSDVILASGLHALYLPILRDAYDLSIYLDIDEGLRRFLKINRDVKVRGHSLERVLTAISEREADAGQFIKPQRDHAQLVLSLLPTNPRLLETATDPSELRFRLLVRSPHGFHEDALVRSLVAICGLHVDVALDGDNSTVEMRIEGETHAEDIALAAKALVPQLLPLLKRPPRWHDGITGLMQLIVLAHLNEAVRRRLL